ncbi:HlyD family secretion protein [Xanthobacter sp. TB0139]|uniref:HlyD family secretion protein n=1 Tax=Xanthobacter sp. TB0139 TaxID=3459178 RepID=UPI00403A429E
MRLVFGSKPIRHLVGLLALLPLLAACDDGERGQFSGYVEGDLLFIGPIEPGRVVEPVVEEGQTVKAGARLARLEAEAQQAAMQGAQARVKQAQAQLENAQAPLQRPQEIAVLEASERRAIAALGLSRIELERQKDLVPRGAASQAMLDAALHQYEQKQAALDEVRQRIAAARIASREKQIEAAREAAAAAAADLDVARVRLGWRTLTAPQGGTIQTVYYREGELVPEGRPVLSLLPPGRIRVRFFVPEETLPRIQPGMVVNVSCNGCPPLTAKVSYIAQTAEYTPPVIYSREERAKLVYLVEARPDVPANARPGQPVTVSLAGGDEI